MVVTSAATLARVAGGQVAAGDPGAMAGTAVIDSREVASGCAFFAIPGERSDGHEFVGTALTGGARIVVVTRADEGVRGRRSYRARGA